MIGRTNARRTDAKTGSLYHAMPKASAIKNPHVHLQAMGLNKSGMGIEFSRCFIFRGLELSDKLPVAIQCQRVLVIVNCDENYEKAVKSVKLAPLFHQRLIDLNMFIKSTYKHAKFQTVQAVNLLEMEMVHMV